MIKTLNARQNSLSKAKNQLDILGRVNHLPSFNQKLRESNHFPLRPASFDILQINVGKMCNQTCSHCHVDAGPDRKEIMTRETMQHCLDVLKDTAFQTVDLTGGAPEMNPDFRWFVEEVSKLNRKVIVRSNLTILVSNKKYDDYFDFFKQHKVIVISSLPCYTEENTDKQRGEGVFVKSLEALRKLNEVGYGKEGSGLELNLVYNPGGPSLPPPQAKLEQDYKKQLAENHGIVFNHLYTITNLPISRFLDYLMINSRYEEYMDRLVHAFNPTAVKGLMCTNTLSVGWDGYLYDCDFNQMLDLKITSASAKHIKDFHASDIMDRNIVVNRHCFGCTAGAGSSCQGALV